MISGGSLLVYSLAFLWAFAIVLFSIPTIISVAHQKGLIESPSHRDSHKDKIPRLGGMAIFAGFASSITIFGKCESGVQYLLAGCILIFFIGLKDDVVSVSPFKKFLMQVLAAFVILFVANIRITDFQGVLGIYLIADGYSYLFTFFIIIGLTNAYNLIDGMDGLAGSQTFISTMILGVLFAYSNGDYSDMAYPSFALAGAALGFLRYNYKRAIIFMGDTGSLLSGFILSIITVVFIERNLYPHSPALAIAVVILPIVDTSRIFFLRLMSGLSPFAPDKNHIHHRLLDLGFSTIMTNVILISFQISCILMVLLFSFLNTTYIIVIIFLFSIISCILLEYFHRSKRSSMTS